MDGAEVRLSSAMARLRVPEAKFPVKAAAMAGTEARMAPAKT